MSVCWKIGSNKSFIPYVDPCPVGYVHYHGQIDFDASGMWPVMVWDDATQQPRPLNEAEQLAAAIAAAIAANQSECRRRILAKWPLEKQASATLGIYPQATADEMMADIAAHISAENAAADLTSVATTLAEVEAITVTWPEV